MWDEMKDDEAMHFQEIGSIFAHFSPTFFELMSQDPLRISFRHFLNLRFYSQIWACLAVIFQADIVFQGKLDVFNGTQDRTQFLHTQAQQII